MQSGSQAGTPDYQHVAFHFQNVGDTGRADVPAMGVAVDDQRRSQCGGKPPIHRPSEKRRKPLFR
jgi:hypothetical protein